MSRVVVDPSANLIPKVIEYLVKKGYNRTEQMLRLESSRLDREGRPIQDRVEDTGTDKYAAAYKLLDTWIKQNLSIYKVSSALLIAWYMWDPTYQFVE